MAETPTPEEGPVVDYQQALKDFEDLNGTLGLEIGAPIDDEMRQRRRRYMQEVLGFEFVSEKEADEENLVEGVDYMEFGADPSEEPKA